MDIKVNFLWIGNKLTEVGNLSLSSFHKLGYECILWAYEDIENIPDFVVIKDANKIVKLHEGRKDLFSDYFRYKLLYKNGGIYSDLDNIIIKELPLENEYVFSGNLNTEVNSHFIKTPKNCPMLKSIIEEIEDYKLFNSSKVFNGEYLLDKINVYNLKDNVLDSFKMNFFNNDMIRLCFEDFKWNELKEIYCIHLFESQHRVVMKKNNKYKQNLINLKKIIL